MSWTDSLAAAVARLAGTRGAILCFHGLDVAGTTSASPMHVPLALLEAVVGASSRVGRFVPLHDLVQRYLSGRGTRGLIALTADDAYVSWLAAEPFLKRHELHLTVFAVSRALNTGQAFWWDRIEHAASHAGPERWKRVQDECGLPEAYRHGQPSTEGPTRALRQWVLAEYRGRWPMAVEEAIVQVEAELGSRTPQRSMTEAELSGFVARTGAQVGVHTVTHAALPFLPDHEIVAEIRHCHDQLRARFPQTRPYLAIPFGLFDDRTLRLSTEAGMTVSLTLAGCPLDRPFSPRFGMPRLCVVREHTPGLLALKTSGVAALLSRIRGEIATSYPVLPSPTT